MMKYLYLDFLERRLCESHWMIRLCEFVYRNVQILTRCALRRLSVLLPKKEPGDTPRNESFRFLPPLHQYRFPRYYSVDLPDHPLVSGEIEGLNVLGWILNPLQTFREDPK